MALSPLIPQVPCHRTGLRRHVVNSPPVQAPPGRGCAFNPAGRGDSEPEAQGDSMVHLTLSERVLMENALRARKGFKEIARILQILPSD